MGTSVKPSISAVSTEGSLSRLSENVFAPESLRLNSHLFWVELPPESYSGYSLGKEAFRDYFPDLSGNGVFQNTLKWEAIQDGCVLELIGSEITLNIHMALKEPAVFIPDVLDIGEEVGWHEGGAILKDGEVCEILGCRLQPTNVRNWNLIMAYRKANFEARTGGHLGIAVRPNARDEANKLLDASPPNPDDPSVLMYKIVGDYNAIRFNNGVEADLERKNKARCFLRYLHQLCRETFVYEFDFDTIVDSFNAEHDLQILSDRLNHDLFKNVEGTGQIFECLDIPSQKYRLLI
jgi:hypothetical protein